MGRTEFTSVNFPKTLVEELKIWKRAYCNVYNRQVSYAEMIRGFLDSMEDIEPAVAEELDNMVRLHPEIMSSLANYRGEPCDDENGGCDGDI